jgi:hypothetical protein
MLPYLLQCKIVLQNLKDKPYVCYPPLALDGENLRDMATDPWNHVRSRQCTPLPLPSLPFLYPEGRAAAV